MHVAAVCRFDAAKGTMVPVKETVGTPSGPSVMEGVSAIGWVHNILYDTSEPSSRSPFDAAARGVAGCVAQVRAPAVASGAETDACCAPHPII
jgi:hypothetical protein